MKKLALIIAVLGMLAMTAPAFAGGSGTLLSDQELDTVYGAHAGGDNDDDYEPGHGHHGFGAYFGGVNMSHAQGIVLVGTMVNSNSAIQVNLAVVGGSNFGSISGSNSVNGLPAIPAP